MLQLKEVYKLKKSTIINSLKMKIKIQFCYKTQLKNYYKKNVVYVNT